MNPDKRNQVIFLALVTGLVVVILYLALVSAMENSLASAKGALSAAERELSTVKSARANEESLKRDSERIAAEIQSIEANMPSGDLFTWILGRVRDMRTPGMTVKEYLQPTRPSENLPRPPAGYFYVRVTVPAVGDFWSLGEFVARLENEYPTMVVEQLSLSPGPAKADGQADLLAELRLLFLVPEDVATF